MKASTGNRRMHRNLTAQTETARLSSPHHGVVPIVVDVDAADEPGNREARSVPHSWGGRGGPGACRPHRLLLPFQDGSALCSRAAFQAKSSWASSPFLLLLSFSISLGLQGFSLKSVPQVTENYFFSNKLSSIKPAQMFA